MNILLKLAQLTARPPGETGTLTGKKVVISKKIVGVLCVLGFICFLLPLILKQVTGLSEMGADFPIEPSAWKVVYSDSYEICGPLVNSESKCLASPSLTDLWQSPYSRIDESHFWKVKDVAGKVFWLGTVIDKEVLEAARKKNANYLMIGYISGESQIWVNGRQVVNSIANQSSLISIPLAFDLLSSRERLYIAIRIVHNKLSAEPDYLMGGNTEGLTTFERHLINQNILTFNGTAKPILISTTEFFMSLLFFLLWVSAPRKQEYFFVFALALICAFENLLLGSFINTYIDRFLRARLDFAATMAEGILHLCLGFAVARLKRDFFTYPIVFGSMFGFFVLLRDKDSSTLLYHSQLLAQYVLPVLSLTAGIACILQSYFCTKIGFGKLFQKSRVSRMLGISMLFFGLAVYYAIQAEGITSVRINVYWFSFVHIGLVLLMGAVVLLDFRDQEIRIQKFAWSKYFNRELIPVRGVFLRLDLIGSESLPSRRDEMSNYASVSSEIRLRFVDTIRRCKGHTLFSEGDEIIAVFDQNECAYPELAVWQAVLNLNDDAVDLETILTEERRIKPESLLLFRASIVSGVIEPYIEISSDGIQEPKWKDSDLEGGPLVLGKRIMELEKILRTTRRSSFVVVSREVTEVLETHQKAGPFLWSQRLIMATNSKNQHFCVSTCELPQPQLKKLRFELTPA